MKIPQDLRELFEKSDYSIKVFSWGFSIRHDPSAKQFLSVFSFIAGVLLLIVSLHGMSWKVTLFSIILIGLPFTLHSWSFPQSVTFSEHHNRVLIRYLRSKMFIDPRDKPELIVEYEARTGFVSPFEEGYQDHYYIFQIKTKSKRVKLFKLKSRNKIDSKVEELVKEFSKLAIWK